MNAIGVFGGTFAPIHHGHIRLALELRERLGLDRVLIVPSAHPPHRASPEVPPLRRLEWARLAVAGEPHLSVDDRETRRLGPSYTYDTLAALRAETGADTPLVLLLGDDAANQLHTWHRWRELIGLAHLVFVERPYEPPAPAPELAAFLRGRLRPGPARAAQRQLDLRPHSAAGDFLHPHPAAAQGRPQHPRPGTGRRDPVVHHRGRTRPDPR